jgi:hypothetical protein
VKDKSTNGNARSIFDTLSPFFFAAQILDVGDRFVALGPYVLVILVSLNPFL